MLLQATCLRRGESYLGLPSCVPKTVSVELTMPEKELYHGILHDCRKQFDKMVSNGSSIKKYNILFTTIMKLRRLCNHGGMSSSQDEQLCEFCCGDSKETKTYLDGLDICPECSRALEHENSGLLTPASIHLPSTSPSPSATSSRLCDSIPTSPTPDIGHRFRGIEERQSSKLLAVVENIINSPPGSKRYSLKAKIASCIANLLVV